MSSRSSVVSGNGSNVVVKRQKSAAGKNNNIVESRNIIVDSDTQPFPTSIESEHAANYAFALDPELRLMNSDNACIFYSGTYMASSYNQ